MPTKSSCSPYGDQSTERINAASFSFDGQVAEFWSMCCSDEIKFTASSQYHSEQSLDYIDPRRWKPCVSRIEDCRQLLEVGKLLPVSRSNFIIYSLTWTSIKSYSLWNSGGPICSSDAVLMKLEVLPGTSVVRQENEYKETEDAHEDSGQGIELT